MNLYIKTALMIIFCYAYLIILLRMLGKKEFSQLNIFDFVVFLLIADLIVLAFDPEKPRLVESLVATSVLALADSFCSYLSLKSKRIRDFLEGTPTYIIEKGKINYGNMQKNRYNMDSLAQHLRQNSISSISEVQYAILETNGTLSIIRNEDSKVLHPDLVIMNGIIMHETLLKVGLNDDWLNQQLKKNNVDSAEEVIYAIVEKDGLFFLKK